MASEYMILYIGNTHTHTHIWGMAKLWYSGAIALLHNTPWKDDTALHTR